MLLGRYRGCARVRKGGAVTACDLYDMHCHLAFSPDARAAAVAMRQQGIGGLCATVTPDEYRLAMLDMGEELARNSNLKLGIGLHPWWLSDGSCGTDAIDKLLALSSQTRFIAEVGLDFAPRRAESAQLQRTTFARIAAASHGKVLSVHAVKSANVALDLMENVGLIAPGTPHDARSDDGTAVIFHWFSGTANELARAIDYGCFFSINPRMLSTKRGRAYVQQIPESKLLLESDLPPAAGDAFHAQEVRSLLETSIDRMAELRQCRSDALAAAIVDNSRSLIEG